MSNASQYNKIDTYRIFIRVQIHLDQRILVIGIYRYGLGQICFQLKTSREEKKILQLMQMTDPYL